ncbi:MAG: DNA polymerase I [Anaerolineales bacterium]|nr:DNA polymerase I [Anaerolineales bacterium]
MPPVLYLIDGHALAYRTFYALTSGSGSGFATRSGEPTAGVYGFTSVLLRILEQERPEYLAVAFDTGRTFRDDLFPAYKGTRAKMPDELRSQIERIRQLVDAFNIPRLEVENYEADDVLGSVTRIAVERGLGVKIITGDRDLLQLVSQRVIVSLPGKSLSDSRDYLPEDVLSFLGVRPDQVVDYKALVGDKSDNIPGVAGVGEKTAASLLQAYQTLDGVYEHLDELSAGVKKKLEAGRQAAYLSRQLATIVCSLDIPLDLDRARTTAFDPDQVEGLFRELEFRSLLPRLTSLEQSYGKVRPHQGQQLSMFASDAGPVFAQSPSSAVRVEADQTRKVVIVDTPEALQALAEQLEKAKVISFDTETTSTDQMRADLVGISLAMEPGTGYYIPVGHARESGQQLPLGEVLQALRAPLMNPRIPKVGHNIKYDFVILARQGLMPAPLIFDSMIAEWLINPASRNLGLKNLAWVRQDIRMVHIDELIGKGKKQISMAEVPIQKAAEYAVADAEVVLHLMPELQEELSGYGAARLFSELEMPLVPVLADMEMAGVALDNAFLNQMSMELSERLGQIESQVYAQVGAPFNLNSPQQLSEVLFDRLKIAPPDRSSRTSTGFYSTSAEVLDSLRGAHVVVDMILEYRELSKLKSTYLDALPLQVNPRTGRIHTSYNQTGAITGRIASSEPNLQNIPIRTELGRKVRNAFIATPGHLLLSVDYSQIELRIVAHMAGDRAMIAAFRAGQDIHAATAAAVYGVSLGAVSKDQRRRAKGINFGLIYGMSPFGLTRATDLTLAEAEDFVKAYFQQFPGVKQYLDGIRRLAAEQGYVETLLGRRRYFPGLKNQSDRNIRGREEREAINAPIQGSAADIMKIAMLRVPAALNQAGFSSRMILQVHDELVLECPQAELQEVASLVQRVMESAYSLDVPLLTEARSGPNWGQMTPLSR